MIDYASLGWRTELVGELDHRRLKAPSVKLRSAQQGPNGDTIFCVDLRVRHPNAGAYLTATELHSMEHFLLEGLQRLLPQHFVSIGIMGCRTGFYLVFLNEGRAQIICTVLQRIFEDMQHAHAVPYASIQQCGHYQDHCLTDAQALAHEILAQRANWLDAA
ncbi:S-ribosylhomocysteine lyase [Castellaniella sp.]|uniref:S-ribosylhomocysteine lyase n=1 Tax=Castellaniella sp. TaxID=1955812 RepID=UPI003A8D879D